MRWDATGYGAHTEKAVDGPATDVVFRGRLAGLLLDLSCCSRIRSASANTRDGAVPARRRAAVDAHVSARADVAPHGRRGRRSGAGRIVVRHDGRRSSSRASPSARCISATTPLWNGGSRIGGRHRAVDDVVPRGRRDRAVLRDVRAARESERQPADGDGDVPAGRRARRSTKTKTMPAQRAR